MHVEFTKPKFDAMGTPIKTKDQYWEATLYNTRHLRIMAIGSGKTKVAARENLQNQINNMLVNKLHKYTQMLNFVTKKEV